MSSTVQDLLIRMGRGKILYVGKEAQVYVEKKVLQLYGQQDGEGAAGNAGGGRVSL